MNLSPDNKKNILTSITDLRTLLDQVESAVKASDNQQVIELLNMDGEDGHGIPPKAYLDFAKSAWLLYQATLQDVKVPVEVGPEEDQVIPGTVDL